MPDVIGIPKQIDGKNLSYIEFSDTWYCECDSTEDEAIQVELAKIPESVSASSLAEVLTPDGLRVYMKHSSGDWIKL